MRWQNACVTPAAISAGIYVESPFTHPSVVFARALVPFIGGYREGDFPEDYELWLRMHAAALRMAKVPRTLLLWRESPARASRTDPRYSRLAFDRLRAQWLARDSRLEGRDVAIWGAGLRTRKRTRLLVDAGVRPVAWIDIDPRKIGRDLWGLPIHPPDWLARRTPRPLVLVYVTNHGARDEIGARLEAWGYRTGVDWLGVG